MTHPALRVVPDRPARLRVITAGDVGNVQSRLGSSGFDIVAVVDTEAELVVAVGNGDPDAIVVEADLCESLEHVHELAPDAALIVVGDHTPAGALGHIDRGVTGAVLARLIQALAAGGLAAVAPIPGFTPAPTPVRLARLTHTARQTLVAGTVATMVAAAVGVSILRGASPVSRLDPTPVVPPSVSTPPQAPDRVLPSDVLPRVPPSTGATPPVEATRSRVVAEAPQAVAAPPAESPAETPPEPPAETPPEPPAETPPADEPDAIHPPGHANGWENKPPKHDDQGNHEGWTNGNGPKD
ncbi:MAG TPA: hypothetical protein VFZ96_10335 [Actinomycetota bacterium]|nr:hypothetical protein [Actinomycetota bacterium]